MDRPAYPVRLFGAVKLGNNYGGAGRKPYEEPHKKIDQGSRRTSYGRQCFLPNEAPYNHGISGVVELLEKRSE